MPKLLIAIALCLMLSGAALDAAIIPGNAESGAKLLRSEQCVTCHSVRGEGGKIAPDLGVGSGRSYTPSYMVTLMWNHAPSMWATMEKQQISRPKLTEEQLADIFAYFHSVRFFERPGDAGRGKEVFESHHCSGCHGLSTPITGGGPALTTWPSLTSPIALAQQMWNHASKMREAMAAKKIKWPELTSQELTDLLVYARNMKETRGKSLEFTLTSKGNGESLLKSKGCLNCHTGKLSLQQRLINGTMTDFTVAMWNHSPKMWEYGKGKGVTPPQLEEEEMREIISYLWYTKLYAESGNVQHGSAVFAKKNCATCHNDPSSGAPNLKAALGGRKDPMTPISMAAVLWQHGPTMMELMTKKNLPWPNFAGKELLDLLAYLNGPEIKGTQAGRN
jgi:mono/diheme cytochrome c family protein